MMAIDVPFQHRCGYIRDDVMAIDGDDYD